MTEALTWRASGVDRTGGWLSPSSKPPRRIGEADDRTTAAAALARVRRGEALVYSGDFRNARQLLAAMGRRLGGHRASRPRVVGGASEPRVVGDPAALYRAERDRRAREHELLGRLLVPIEAGLLVPLRHAPDVGEALREALGPAPDVPGLLPLRDLLGIIGAHEWRRRGVEVPALGARIHPHYGVYAPIRGEYVELVAEAARTWPIAGRRVLEIGTGTGVLALVLARAGARVVATDVEPRAIACARENAARLGLSDRVEVVLADLFPPDGESFDVVLSNPPWLPGAARSPLERAVFDPGGTILERLIAGIPGHLAFGGEAWVVISDLAELLGLRPVAHVGALAERAGLRVASVLEVRPSHPRAGDERDPLHPFRAREVTRLLRLSARDRSAPDPE